VIKLNLETLKADRNEIFTQLRQAGIGVNVHYLPVHLHPFYRERFGTKAGDCPVAESVYERILTLPMYPKLTQMDLDFTITATLESIFYNSI
jgi:perosamine synthetase